MSRETTSTQIRQIIGDCFDVAPDALNDTTVAPQVVGWDSLAHTILLMKIEEHFKIDLPLDKIYQIKNVGELIDAVQSVLA